MIMGLFPSLALSLSLSLSLYSRTNLSHASLQYMGVVLMEFLSRLHLSANHVTSCQIASCVTKPVASWEPLRPMYF